MFNYKRYRYKYISQSRDRLLYLNKDWLQNNLAENGRPEIIDWKLYLEQQHNVFNNNFKTQEPKRKITKDDLHFIKELGEGAFGKVLLSIDKKTKEYYAVKIIDKGEVHKSKTSKNVLNEKRLLVGIQFPFIIQMESFFEFKNYLYIVLQFMPCGDLADKLHHYGRFDEPVSRFFAAQVLLAIEYLHHLDILYRDIKPENILVDLKGYIKLTDFGLAKQVKKSRTYTFCGTPEYIAPEIILSKGYGKSVDYWSFGILLYEFSAGYSPFYAKSPLLLYSKIVTGKYSEPPYFSNDLKSIIKGILQTDITKRYGVLKNGINEIKNHKWFEGIIWLALANKVIRAPFTPTHCINQ